jgi:hypothetical protein
MSSPRGAGLFGMTTKTFSIIGSVTWISAALAAAACGGSNSGAEAGATTSATATSSSSSASTGSGGGGGGAPAPEYAAVIRGKLASMDLAMAKATHDAIAKGGESQAKMAGDHAHDVLLGTTMLDSIENEFLAIDRWDDAKAMKAFYADPNVQKAFGGLFAAPPSVEFFVYEPTWANWGDMQSGDKFNPYYFHFAIGQLAQSDEEKNHTAHDMVANGGKQPALGAGNLAHVVFLGLDDKRQFLGVDIWGKPDNIVPFYTNPEFVKAFAPLFTSAKQPVYHSTDWYQW